MAVVRAIYQCEIRQMGTVVHEYGRRSTSLERYTSIQLYEEREREVLTRVRTARSLDQGYGTDEKLIAQYHIYIAISLQYRNSEPTRAKLGKIKEN